MNDAKITVPALLARKQRGPKIAMLTAYDATMARLLDEGGAVDHDPSASDISGVTISRSHRPRNQRLP